LASIFNGYGYDCEQHWQVFSMAMDMIVNNIGKYFLWLWIGCEQHWQVFSMAMDIILNNIGKYFLWLWI